MTCINSTGAADRLGATNTASRWSSPRPALDVAQRAHARPNTRRSWPAQVTRPRAAPGAGKGVRRRTRTPVLPQIAARVLATARRSASGCLISHLTPSQTRPAVWIGDRQVPAARVVAAATIGRPLEAHEDAHHECETRRCVEPTHLAVIPAAEHQAHHAAQRRRAVCARHQRGRAQSAPSTSKAAGHHRDRLVGPSSGPRPDPCAPRRPPY